MLYDQRIEKLEDDCRDVVFPLIRSEQSRSMRQGRPRTFMHKCHMQIELTLIVYQLNGGKKNKGSL